MPPERRPLPDTRAAREDGPQGPAFLAPVCFLDSGVLGEYRESEPGQGGLGQPDRDDWACYITVSRLRTTRPYKSLTGSLSMSGSTDVCHGIRVLLSQSRLACLSVVLIGGWRRDQLAVALKTLLATWPRASKYLGIGVSCFVLGGSLHLQRICLYLGLHPY